MHPNKEFPNATEVQAHQPQPPEIIEGSAELQESWREKFGRAKDSVVNLFNGLGEKFRKSPEAQAETSQEGVATLGEILEQNPQQMAELQKTVSKRDWKKITGQVVTGVGVAGAVAFGAPVIMAGTGVVGLTAGTYAAASIGVGTYASVGLATMGTAAPVIASASAAASLGLARLGRLMQGNPYAKEKQGSKQEQGGEKDRNELILNLGIAFKRLLDTVEMEEDQEEILERLDSRMEKMSDEELEKLAQDFQTGNKHPIHDLIREVILEYRADQTVEENSPEEVREGDSEQVDTTEIKNKQVDTEKETITQEDPEEIEVEWKGVDESEPKKNEQELSNEKDSESEEEDWFDDTYQEDKETKKDAEELSLEADSDEKPDSLELSPEEKAEKDYEEAMDRAREMFREKGVAPEDEERAMTYLTDTFKRLDRDWYTDEAILTGQVNGVLKKLETDFNFDPTQLEKQRNEQEYGRLIKTIDDKPDYFAKDAPGINSLENDLRREVRDTVNNKLRQLDPQNPTDMELIMSQSGGQLLEEKVQQWYNRQAQGYLNTLSQEPIEGYDPDTEELEEEAPGDFEKLIPVEQATLDLQTKDYKLVKGKKQMFKIRQDLSKALRPQIEKYDLPLTVNSIRLKESYNSFFNQLSKYSGEERKDYLAKGVGAMFYEGMRSLPQEKRAEIINALIAENKEKDSRFAGDYLSNPEIKRFVNSPARELMNTSTTLDMALGALLTWHYLELPTVEDSVGQDNQSNEENTESNTKDKINHSVEEIAETNETEPLDSSAVEAEMPAEVTQSVTQNPQESRQKSRGREGLKDSNLHEFIKDKDSKGSFEVGVDQNQQITTRSMARKGIKFTKETGVFVLTVDGEEVCLQREVQTHDRSGREITNRDWENGQNFFNIDTAGMGRPILGYSEDTVLRGDEVRTYKVGDAEIELSTNASGVVSIGSSRPLLIEYFE